ncbi:MAG: hydrolase [Christensenellaceae bacterium]|jgi:hypothetical protein|nr:hydrolase [Christensenellaceae bacterium]
MDIEKGKEEFIEIFQSFIGRDGGEELLEYLESDKCDFFTAPASASYHLAEEGGLCAHSINVYNRLLKLLQMEYGTAWEEHYSHESVAICALLHDLCKIGCYKVSTKNVKNGEKWEKVPFFQFDEDLPYGHGEKSVYIISAFLRLTREEALAINWHMGAYDARVKGDGSREITKAFEKYPLCVFLHIADMLAANVDEGTNKQ